MKAQVLILSVGLLLFGVGASAEQASLAGSVVDAVTHKTLGVVHVRLVIRYQKMPDSSEHIVSVPDILQATKAADGAGTGVSGTVGKPNLYFPTPSRRQIHCRQIRKLRLVTQSTGHQGIWCLG